MGLIVPWCFCIAWIEALLRNDSWPNSDSVCIRRTRRGALFVDGFFNWKKRIEKKYKWKNKRFFSKDMNSMNVFVVLVIALHQRGTENQEKRLIQAWIMLSYRYILSIQSIVELMYQESALQDPSFLDFRLAPETLKFLPELETVMIIVKWIWKE